MTTEEGVQRFWNTSLAWRGRIPTDTTIEGFFRQLDPLYGSRSHALVRQVSELGDMIVKLKAKRPGRRKKGNVVLHPHLSRMQAAGEPGRLSA